MPDSAIDVLHVDDACLVVGKPCGMLSVPGKGQGKADCLIARLHKRWPDALTVHRLDQSTSGVVVLARGKANERHLSMQFQARTVQKRYQAQVWGWPEADNGLIDAPIGQDWEHRPMRHIDWANGRPSQTRWRVLQRMGGGALPPTSLLDLEPLTGRTHQLRVHMAHLGHPMLGDHLYAPDEAYNAAPRLMLHAAELAFDHPITQARMLFSQTWTM
jgi:tRNA pseudouridine32 synthase / 23S rRNA pseudouridine746 synthase